MNDLKIKQRTVFIIEDNLVLSMIINRLVTSLGYEVLGDAKSGEDAIEKIKILKPEIVLTDVRLDGVMNGIETVKTARMHSDFQTIFISGSADDSERLKAEKVGYIEYLLKPVRKVDLANALQKTEMYLRRKMGKSAMKLVVE
tara:strand:+ start:12887 stop:13315 length:429 start_codon:yes stop_codon:yes gene_type:complete